jgi:hypothetical protein
VKSGTLAVKPEYDAVTILAKDRMIRSDRWKLVYQPLNGGLSCCRLFDTLSDPNCECDISMRVSPRSRGGCGGTA